MGDGMLSLSWNNHKATFCHILANLRDKERYTDVTLACEGKFYRVHKLVLSTCSEYFEVMFENTPCKHPVIVLNHIKHDEVEALLSYMYAGVVNVAQNDLARLIKAAELLKIKGLAVPDEPPQEAEAKKSQPSPWNSRDDRTSPLPKRRRRDDSGTPHGGSVASNSPASSPRASPYTESIDYLDKSRTHSEGQSSERRGERADYRSDPLSARLDDNSHRKEQRGSSQDSSGQNNILDETLVKEEVIDASDDRSNDILDSGMDYGGVSDPLDTSNDGSNTGLPNKYEPQGLTSQSHMGEPVVEALAGPSGMQGWLGDIGGFSSVESFRGEGSQQDIRQALPGQQPQQMAVVVGDNNLGEANRIFPIAVRNLFRLEAASNFLQQRMMTPILQLQEKHSTTTKPTKENIESDVSEHPNALVKVAAVKKCKPRGGYKKGLKKRIFCDLKSYDCSYCSYFTYGSTNLLNHMRTHTGEKPFACDYCPYRSTQKGNLKTHVNKHHSDFTKELDNKTGPKIKIVDVKGMVSLWHDSP